MDDLRKRIERLEREVAELRLMLSRDPYPNIETKRARAFLEHPGEVGSSLGKPRG